MNKELTIAFAGAGSMAEALIAGLVQQNHINKKNIIITNRANNERLQYFEDNYEIRTTRDVKALAEQADIIIFAMKPKDVAEGIESIKEFIGEHHLLISVLAGVSTNSMNALLGKKIPIVRAMPNTSAAIGRSATAIAKGLYANDNHLSIAAQIFETVGITCTVEEELLHAVTGLSGSGPAYVYYLVEAMEKAAGEIGMDSYIAKELIIQTLIGAAEMLRHSPKQPGALRQEVTSPGGTTEAGLQKLKTYQFEEGIIECIKRATERSRELGAVIEEKILSPRS